MEAHTLHRRLIALVCGVVVAACAIAAICMTLPRQSERDATKDYGYVYASAKSSSVDFVRANLTDDSLLMLGSSEFSTPASTVKQVPATVFGLTNYGIRPMLVGEAYDQALWHAIALGALADGGLPRNKVVLVVSLGEYTDGGLDNATFGERFSYTLYQAFCDNEAIDAQTRAYVRARLLKQGIDETTVRAAECSDPLQSVDATVLSLMDDLRLRAQLADVRSRGIPLAQNAVRTPDWAALRAQALEEAARQSTTNDWGADDDFWTGELAPVLDKLEGARAEETYTTTPEYDDLACFMDVCDACGVQPLIVIEPSMGPYYDYIGISAQTRAAAYQRIRDVVRAHPNARLADFSDREYERYFLFDIVHFGWTGWIDAEQAIYEFALGN